MSAQPETERIKAAVNSLNNLLLGLHGYVHFMESSVQKDSPDAAYLGPMRELLNRAYEMARQLMGEVQTLEQELAQGRPAAPLPALPAPLPAPTPFTHPIHPIRPATQPLPPPTSQSAKTATGRITLTAATPIPIPVPVKAAAPAAADFTGLDIRNPTGPKGLIFFVDDEDFLLDFAANILVKDGYRVLTCQESFNALQIFTRIHTEVSLVILDYSMPVMNGEDLFREMMEVNPATKILLSSGYFEYEVVSRLLKRGLIAFLPKPYTRQSFLQNVANAILSETMRPG